MYLLYVDESGHPADRNQAWFVLGGVAVFERQMHWLGRELDAIASRFDLAAPRPLELHGSPMLNGREGWEAVPRETRLEAIKDALNVLRLSKESTVAICVAVRKAAIAGLDPVEWAFEQLCTRFDEFLKQLYREQKRPSKEHNHVSHEAQRGLMIFDESTRETSLQRLALQFRNHGGRMGVLRNITEVPLFADSRATRLIQLADLLTYSVFRFVERNDSRLLDIVRDRFHRVAGFEHGLLIKHT